MSRQLKPEERIGIAKQRNHGDNHWLCLPCVQSNGVWFSGICLWEMFAHWTAQVRAASGISASHYIAVWWLNSRRVFCGYCSRKHYHTGIEVGQDDCKSSQNTIGELPGCNWKTSGIDTELRRNESWVKKKSQRFESRIHKIKNPVHPVILSKNLEFKIKKYIMDWKLKNF